MDYMDEDPLVLMLREEETRWEPLAIVEATTELKNWALEGAAHPLDDFAMKIKTIEPTTPIKKIKTIELVTPTDNIVSIPIESISASITIPVESVCDSIPIELVFVESVKNTFPYNMISDFAYLLALIVFISDIGKETFNNKVLKQGHLEPLKEETQPINLGTNDEPKMIQVSNTLTIFEKEALVVLPTEFKEVFEWSYEDMPGIDIDIV